MITFCSERRQINKGKKRPNQNQTNKLTSVPGKISVRLSTEDAWEERDQNVKRNYLEEREVEGKETLFFLVDDGYILGTIYMFTV